MPQTSSERGASQAAFRGAARALFISGDTIDAFLASATPGQVAACTAMLESEIAHRDGAKRARLLRQARFPVPKALDGFDWSNVAFPDGWGRDQMCSLAFVRDAEDLVFYGQTGRGKTHMATALGIAATSAGYPVRFFQTAQLVLQLGKAKREGALDRLLADIARARLLVLDEFGYVPFDVDGARLLYQVISESYERRSVISTANVESGRLGHRLRGRQARGGDRRPRRAPRQARGVRGPEPRAGGEPHAGQVGEIGRRRRARDETRKSSVHRPERNPCSKPKSGLD